MSFYLVADGLKPWMTLGFGLFVLWCGRRRERGGGDGFVPHAGQPVPGQLVGGLLYISG